MFFYLLVSILFHLLQVPCHRVVATTLKLGTIDSFIFLSSLQQLNSKMYLSGGFFGSTDPKGPLLQKKLKLLIEEGVMINAITDTQIKTTENIKVSSASLFQFSSQLF
jgi:alkylated DNA nucleotide flippase Atl1